MKPATEVLRTGQWAGRPAFVIGGGPSLKGFDYFQLDRFLTLGVNAAFMWRPTVWYSSDRRLVDFHSVGEAWRGWKTIKLVHYTWQEQGVELPECYYVPLAPPHVPPVLWGESLDEGIAAAGNSGLMALNIADVLGADPIFLLGFDLNDPPEGRLSHWHHLYPDAWIPSGQWCQKALEEFRRQGALCRARVYNLSPASAIDVFPKMTIEEGLELAQGCLELDGESCQRCNRPLTVRNGYEWCGACQAYYCAVVGA
jgi:hypothetical protein